MYFYIILPMCNHIFMYDGRDKNTNFHVVHIAKKIFNETHIKHYGSVMKNEKKNQLNL